MTYTLSSCSLSPIPLSGTTSASVFESFFLALRSTFLGDCGPGSSVCLAVTLELFLLGGGGDDDLLTSSSSWTWSGCRLHCSPPSREGCGLYPPKRLFLKGIDRMGECWFAKSYKAIVEKPSKNGRKEKLWTFKLQINLLHIFLVGEWWW